MLAGCLLQKGEEGLLERGDLSKPYWNPKTESVFFGKVTANFNEHEALCISSMLKVYDVL